MPTVRRRVIRPQPPPPSAAALRLPRLRARLDEEQAAGFGTLDGKIEAGVPFV